MRLTNPPRVIEQDKLANVLQQLDKGSSKLQGLTVRVQLLKVLSLSMLQKANKGNL